MRRILILVVVLGVLVSGVALAGRHWLPGLWVEADAFIQKHFGWTEKARQQDPVGYASYVLRRLHQDMQKLSELRRELIAEIAELSNKMEEQRALLLHSERLAAEFRTRYHEATRSGNFPVAIRGAAYTSDQLKSQIGLLLAEAKAYREAIERLMKVREEAETQLEVVTARLNRTEAEIAVISAQRQLLQAREIIARQGELLERLEPLFADNQQVLVANPVRTVRELIVATPPPTARELRREEIESFLASDGPAESSPSEVQNAQAMTSGNSASETTTAVSTNEPEPTVDSQTGPPSVAAEGNPQTVESTARESEPASTARNAAEPTQPREDAPTAVTDSEDPAEYQARRDVGVNTACYNVASPGREASAAAADRLGESQQASEATLSDRSQQAPPQEAASKQKPRKPDRPKSPRRPVQAQFQKS